MIAVQALELNSLASCGSSESSVDFSLDPLPRYRAAMQLRPPRSWSCTVACWTSVLLLRVTGMVVRAELDRQLDAADSAFGLGSRAASSACPLHPANARRARCPRATRLLPLCRILGCRRSPRRFCPGLPSRTEGTQECGEGQRFELDVVESQRQSLQKGKGMDLT